MRRRTWTELAIATSSKLDKIYIWLYQNNLILNLSEISYIKIGNYSDSVPEIYDIVINGNILEGIAYCKYLGVTYYDTNIK